VVVRAEYGAAAGIVGIGDRKRAIVVEHSAAPCHLVLCPFTEAPRTGLYAASSSSVFLAELCKFLITHYTRGVLVLVT